MLKVISVVLVLFALSDAAYLRQKRESPACPENCTHGRLEVSFVVDASASIWQPNFQRCLSFIEEFAKMFQIGQDAVRMSMVTFGAGVYEQDAFGLSAYSDLQSLTKAINDMPYRSGMWTDTASGMKYVLENQMSEARQGVRHVVIVITDGQSQKKKATEKAAQELHATNVEVFAIGVGSEVSMPELHTIATDNRHVIEVDSYDMLHSIQKRLAYEACDVPTFPECEMDPVDLAFVIDSSLSIGKENFTEGMDFIRDFVDSFQIDPNHIRVAAITFGHQVFKEDGFHFDSFKTKQEVLDRLAQIKWRKGRATATGDGIKYMRDVQMPKARDNVPHVCIVITDGKSQRSMQTRQEAQAARDNGITMYAVGVGTAQTLDYAELEGIAGEESRVIKVTSYKDLNLIKDQLIDITCESILHEGEQKGAQHKLIFKQPAEE